MLYNCDRGDHFNHTADPELLDEKNIEDDEERTELNTVIFLHSETHEKENDMNLKQFRNYVPVDDKPDDLDKLTEPSLYPETSFSNSLDDKPILTALDMEATWSDVQNTFTSPQTFPTTISRSSPLFTLPPPRSRTPLPHITPSMSKTPTKPKIKCTSTPNTTTKIKYTSTSNTTTPYGRPGIPKVFNRLSILA